MATKENISFVTVNQPLTWSHLSTMDFLADSSPGAGLTVKELSRSLSVWVFPLLGLHRALTLFFTSYIFSRLCSFSSLVCLLHLISLCFSFLLYFLFALREQTDCFAIANYVFKFAALGGEYKAKQNRCCELGVVPRFKVKTFLKYKNVPELMILKVRKDFMVFKQRDFIAKWFTVVDFHTLEAMFLLTTKEKKEAPLSLFSEPRSSSQDQCCLKKIEVNLWRKKESKYFRKLFVPAS